VACGSKGVAASICNPVNVIKTKMEGYSGQNSLKSIEVIKNTY
jgi:hypothetical protein